MTWIAVGTSTEIEKRDRPNVWVTLQASGSDIASLSPLQARELATMLIAAADHVEKVKTGTLVCVVAAKS